MTKIFHPNVAPESGDICVNSLKRDWKPETTLTEILQVIRCLIIEPNPESALNEEAGKLFMESYEEYSRKAKILTEVHATSSEEEEENIAIGTNGVNVTNILEGKLSNSSHGDSSNITKVKLIQSDVNGGVQTTDSSLLGVESKEIVAIQKVKDVKKKALKRL